MLGHTALVHELSCKRQNGEGAGSRADGVEARTDVSVLANLMGAHRNPIRSTHHHFRLVLAAFGPKILPDVTQWRFDAYKRNSLMLSLCPPLSHTSIFLSPSLALLLLAADRDLWKPA